MSTISTLVLAAQHSTASSTAAAAAAAKMMINPDTHYCYCYQDYTVTYTRISLIHCFIALCPVSGTPVNFNRQLKLTAGLLTGDLTGVQETGHYCCLPLLNYLPLNSRPTKCYYTDKLYTL